MSVSAFEILSVLQRYRATGNTTLLKTLKGTIVFANKAIARKAQKETECACISLHEMKYAFGKDLKAPLFFDNSAIEYLLLGQEKTDTRLKQIKQVLKDIVEDRTICNNF